MTEFLSDSQQGGSVQPGDDYVEIDLAKWYEIRAEAERLRAALSGLSDRVLNLGGFMHKRPCAEAEFYVKRADVLAQIAVTVALTTGNGPTDAA